MGVPRHRHLFRRQVARIAPGPAHRRALRRDPLLRLPGRRRPAGAHRRPDRRRRTAPTSPPGPGSPASSARASGWSASAPATSRPAASSRSAPGSSSTPPACGPTRSRRWSAAAASLNVQASKGIHLVVPRDRIRSEAGFIMRTETSVLFVIPWGRHWIIGTTDTAWDLDKAHPAAVAPTSTTSSATSTPILREPLDHEDVEGVYAGLRPLLSGESRADRRGSPASTPWSRPVPGPGDDRRRQAHDVPGDGAGRRRRRRALARATQRRRSGLRSPTGCRWSAPTGFETRTNQRVDAGPALRAARRADRPPARAGTAAWSTSCSTWSPTGPSWASRSTGPRTTCRRGRLRRHPRGRPPPRRRAHPAYPHLDRDLRPRRRAPPGPPPS